MLYEVITVVLVGLGVVGVADVHPQRHTQKLAAEMVLEPRADDLLAIEQILRPDEADHRVDEQRIKSARDAVGARFQRLLVAAVVRLRRQAAALPSYNFV